MARTADSFCGDDIGCVLRFFIKDNLKWAGIACTYRLCEVIAEASIWSLLPAMEQTSDMERWSFIPAVVEFWLGMVFLLGLERLIPHLHRGGLVVEKIKSCLGN